jgi:hypothetical protein
MSGSERVNLFRDEAVGFIDWLGAFFHIAQSILNLPVAPAVLFVE